MAQRTLTKLLFQDLQEDDNEAVGEAMRNVFQMCEKSQYNCEKAYALGAQAIIAVVLEKWSDNDEDISTYGHACIETLIGSLENPDFLVWALGTFSNDLGVQATGLLKLGKLFENHCSEQEITTFVEQNVLDQIVNGVDNFSDDGDIKAAACFTLRQICEAGDFKQQVIASGSLKLVSTAVTQFPSDESIKEDAKAVMKIVLNI